MSKKTADIFNLFLMAVGILIMTVSGVCTATIGGATLLSAYRTSHVIDTSLIFITLVVGGAPFTLGFILFMAGKRGRSGQGT